MDHAFQPAGRDAHSRGRNAADIELTVAAMDLLHDARIDGFCVVSNDSDFAPLALRPREAGRFVIGMGESHAANEFVPACDQFVRLDASAPLPKEATRGPDSRDAFLALLGRALARVPAHEDGWVPLSSVAVALFAAETNFHPWKYGSTSLRALVESSSPEVETKRIPSGLMVQARTVAGAAERPPSAA